jgi:hypothetical protein
MRNSTRRSQRFTGAATISRRAWFRWAAVLLLAAPAIGCMNEMVMLAYLIGGPPSIEPDFDAQTNKSMTAKDVTVAVVCYAPTEVRFDFADIDKELGTYVAHRLHQHHVQVVSPDRIHAWLDENPDWDKAEEIGQAFEAAYVVYIDLENYSLYEKNSANLYRGRSEAIVSVFEMDADGHGEKIYSKEVHSEFPLHAPRSTSEVTYQTFKRQYLSRLSEEIGRLFYEHYFGDNISDGT